MHLIHASIYSVIHIWGDTPSCLQIISQSLINWYQSAIADRVLIWWQREWKSQVVFETREVSTMCRQRSAILGGWDNHINKKGKWRWHRTNQTIFRKRHFQMHFLEWNHEFRLILTFISSSPIDNKATWFPKMTWYRIVHGPYWNQWRPSLVTPRPQ